MLALGYLGWSEPQALAADVNAILVGYEGVLHKIHYIYGTPEPERVSPNGAHPPLTPGAFDKTFIGKTNDRSHR